MTAPELRESLLPLAEYRRREGMRVTVLETTDVLTPRQIADGDSAPLRQRIAQLCREAKGRAAVLLVGLSVADGVPEPAKFVTPALKGSIARMKGEPTDNGYGCLGESMLPDVAVGRLPARTPGELTAMIQKMLAFERDNSPAAWRNQLTFLVGNPGGDGAAQRKLSDLVVGNMIGAQLGRLDPAWNARILVHAPTSEYCVPDDKLRQVSLDYLQQGQVFSFYGGHSNATGFWSGDVPFVTREDWTGIQVPRGAGVFVTAGCHCCQLKGPGGEGYGLAAIRNPAGPVAVIGACGESYAIAGKLAGEGLLACLEKPNPPARLGEYWLVLKRSLATQPVDILTFWMFDQADGTRGQVPLEVQRQEHLEMWMLLGDPALKLPLRRATLPITVRGDAVPGGTIEIRGELPTALARSKVRVTIERLPGSRTPGLKPPPAEAGKAAEAMLESHRLANQVELVEVIAMPRDGNFSAIVALPKELSWPQLVVRATATGEQESALGVLRLPVKKPAAGPSAKEVPAEVSRPRPSGMK